MDSNNSLLDQERKYWRLRFELVKDYLDISNLPLDHNLFIYNSDRKNELLAYQRANWKKLGLFKSEIPEKRDTAISVCSLRPKLYSMLLLGEIVNDKTTHVEIKKAKGVSKASAERMTFNHYLNVLENRETIYTVNYTFRSKNHELYLQALNKVSASLCDFKRLWVDKQNSLPFYYPIENEEDKALIYGNRNLPDHDDDNDDHSMPVQVFSGE